MDDKTYIKCDFKQFPDPKFYTSIVRGRVRNNSKYKSLDKLGKKLLLWQAICSCGLSFCQIINFKFRNFGELAKDICVRVAKQ